MLDNFVELFAKNTHILVVAGFGGIVLFGLKCAAHYHRPEPDKLSNRKYIGLYLLLLIVLPGLGMGVMAIYLLNGDKISPFLAFQIGLTSPAIVQGMVVAAANQMATSAREDIATGQ